MLRKTSILLLTLIVLIMSMVVTSGWFRFSLTPERVNHYFHYKYPQYTVNFDMGQVTWRIGRLTLDLNLQQVSVIDGLGSQVVSIPSLVVEMDMLSVLRGAPQVQLMRFDQPLIQLKHSADKSFNIKIGTFGRESLISLPQQTLAEYARHLQNDLFDGGMPEIRIDEARLILFDERSGARFVFDPFSLAMDHDKKVLSAKIKLGARTHGEILSISLEANFDPHEMTIYIDGEFDNVNPAILSEMLPNLRLLSLIEVVLRGDVTAVLNVSQARYAVSLVVQSGPGSFEVAQYSGRNITLENLRADISYKHEIGVLKIENIMISLEDGKLTGNLRSTSLGSADQNIRGDLILSGSSVSYFLPRWFSSVDQFDSGLVLNSTHVRKTQRLRFESYLYGEGERLRGWGTLDLGFPGREHLYFSDKLHAALPVSRKFFLDGSVTEPKITFNVH